MRFLFLLLITSALFSLPEIASAGHRVEYKTVDVLNGGTIKGTIRSSIQFEDPVIPINIQPKPDPKEAALEKLVCGSSQKGNIYILSADNGVRNALVIVEDVKQGIKPPHKDISIDNIECRFEPLISISYAGSNYVIKNSDPFFHNVNMGKKLRKGVRRTVYNLALPFKDQTITKPTRGAGLIDIKCVAHPWMRAYIYSSDHPYIAITDKNGKFEIRDLLPGKYRIRIWHEGFEDLTEEVEVEAGAVLELNAVFTATRTPAFLRDQ